MYQLIYSLFPIILLSVIVLAMTVFVFIQTPGKNLLKLLLIPTAIFTGITAPVIFITLMGYPVFVELPDKFTVIAHNMVIVNSEKKYIELWVKTESKTRLYMIKYTKEMEKQIEEGEEGKHKGRVGVFTKKKSGKNQSNDESQFSTELFETFTFPSKEPV